MVDPTRRYCRCGYSWKLNRLHLIRLLFHDITISCPRCQCRHRYHMTRFVNEVFKETKGDNKQINETKEILWRQC